ncbi:DUF1707 domain-containing protein [Nonomuraea sp. NN258]|uniref:DUF1707 SHOCT-like domain-containing protein n=1 Tax=Nonomuraea antri TaxID=2730852 RepID=UPI00156A4D21|nr:DUF1707 domain-containing protein [Nonomuraea antri]NRQ30967.1 DUF1707 domain-containing protein [Nonomuraea antri]
MDPNDLRIGDAEREQTMAALREHFAQGRLTHEELDERLDRALAAKTARDLAAVTSDLPGAAYREAGSPYAPADPHEEHGGHGWHGWHGGLHPHEGHHRHGRHDVDGWHEAMRAHRRQMQAMHRASREQVRAMHQARREMHRGRRGHHGPSPMVPILVALAAVGLMVGGFGLVKMLIVVVVVSFLIKAAHRRFHCRD